MVTEFDDVAAVRDEERGYAAATHLLAAIPVWGVLFIFGIWVYFKERSRQVVFHVQQAIVFHIVLLGVGVACLATGVLARIIGIVSHTLQSWIDNANVFLAVLCYILYALTCLAGAFITYSGRPFFYPLIGRRILEGTLTKPTPED